MFFAFVTTILFALSAVTAARSIRLLGSMRANFARLVVAAVCLAALAHSTGGSASGPGFWWFFLSGVVGFGLGDIALFYAYPRIGPRLAVLLTQCIAAPVAALAEWSWLGTRPSGVQIVCGAIILAGVALALAPGGGDRPTAQRSVFIIGLLAGLGAAFGQGLGAVISRKAYDVYLAHGLTIDGVTATYQRILGGILLGAFTLVSLRQRTPASTGTATTIAETPPPIHAGRFTPAAIGWIIVNALVGPVFGVICFQQALGTTASGVVLPIIALTPIVVMPLAFFFEGDRPSLRSILGGLIAVAGAAALARAA